MGGVGRRSRAGARDRTLESYERVLGYVIDILGRDVDPLAVDRDDLLDVLARWRGLQPATIANRVSVMRSFFAWLAEEYGVENPAAKLRRPRKPRTVRRRLAPSTSSGS